MPKTSSTRTTSRRARVVRASLALGALGLAASCGFDRTDRWDLPAAQPLTPACDEGSARCNGGGVEHCQLDDKGVAAWVVTADCASQAQVCVPGLLACRNCAPGATTCDGQTVMRCDDAGNASHAEQTCSGDGVACRGGVCQNLCGLAAKQRSNVGCEYWAVDLDNADISDSLNAAAQQFAVVVSNAQPDVAADVTIEQDDSAPGQPNAPLEIATATIPPLSLRVFKLGPREVDGSPPGEYNTGTHTALTRHAYRVKSSVPVVAYQFNPLENVNVFSNDASLLKPVEALSISPGSLVDSYVAIGWPQTIASTDYADTNFNPSDPIDLRAFLTIVGTRPDTHVRVTSSTKIVAGGPVKTSGPAGTLDVTLQPFDVLNLETDDFNADFTGSVIAADAPVVVFSGSEASDAPYFSTLATRQCCADHLEEQLDPVRTAGKHFVASLSSNRTRAVAAAGGDIGVIDQPEYFRIIATTDGGAHVTTTLGGKLAAFDLAKKGSFTTITTSRDFMLSSDHPVMLGNVTPSQDAAGVPRGLPGGDPSFIVIPPIEQYRPDYVFLTPDKYSFDFIRIIAPLDATIVFDGQPLADVPGCTTLPADGLTTTERGSADPPFVVHTCQLSFPVIDPTQPAPANLSPGKQNDGVHRVTANAPVGVIVDGFDSYVSYGYAAGTQLTEIVPQ